MKLVNVNHQYWNGIFMPLRFILLAIGVFIILYQSDKNCSTIFFGSASICKVEVDENTVYFDIVPSDKDSVFHFVVSNVEDGLINKYEGVPHSFRIIYKDYSPNSRWYSKHKRIVSLEIDNKVIEEPKKYLRILIPSIIGLIGIIGVIFVIKGFRRGDFDELTKNGKSSQQVVEENTVPEIVSKSQTRFVGDDYCVNMNYDGVILTVFFNENLVEFCRDYRLDAEINYSDNEIAELVESIRKNPGMYKDMEIVY